MAKYNITNLNYISIGDNRCFINLDSILEYQIYDFVHLLCAETKTSGYTLLNDKINNNLSAISVDIGLEQGDGHWNTNEYIQKELPNNKVIPLSEENQHLSIILNENKTFYYETDYNNRKYIRLYLSCCTEEMKEKIRQFNKDREHINCTYVADILNYGNSKNGYEYDDTNFYVHNIYDIIDVSIQMKNQHDLPNSEIEHTDRKHELYVPLSENPIGFCQSQLDNEYLNDCILLTQNKSIDPYILHTDMLDTRYIEEKTNIDYDVELKNRSSKLYTYKAENERLSTDNFIDMFDPVRNYRNVQRAYVVDLAVDNSFNVQLADNSHYDAGEIYYNRLHISKSAYNYHYDMEMSDQNTLTNNRKYCGINVSAGRPYLKFYNVMKYNGLSADNKKKISEITTEYSNALNDSKNDTTTVPYQQIEYLYPADYSYTAKHKSNTFTVNINDTKIKTVEEKLYNDDGNLIDNSEEGIKIANNLQQLQLDITHAVKQIADCIAPANTQLIDVTFGD